MEYKIPSRFRTNTFIVPKAPGRGFAKPKAQTNTNAHVILNFALTVSTKFVKYTFAFLFLFLYIFVIFLDFVHSPQATQTAEFERETPRTC